jgi:site-specific recombinase XerD
VRVAIKRRRYRDFITEDYLPRLDARVAQGELRASTATQYKRDIRKHLLSAFGQYRVDDIDVERIERFRDKLTADGLSNDSVRRIITTLGYTLKLRPQMATDRIQPRLRCRQADDTATDTITSEPSGHRAPREGDAHPRDIRTRSLRSLLRRAQVGVFRASLV